MRRFYLVSYDIIDDKRRNKVFKILMDYGDRVQYSVFCCQLNERELLALQEKLRTRIHMTEDQVLFVDAGPVFSSQPMPDILYLGRTWAPEPRVQII